MVEFSATGVDVEEKNARRRTLNTTANGGAVDWLAQKQHLRIVKASGSSVLSKRASLSVGAILNIKRGKTKRIRRSTERKIFEAGVSIARAVSL